METRIRTADERRAEIEAAAAKMGIDDAYISTLVDTFYARVRADPDLGPIFEEKIGDNWDAHLARMKDFWASVALNAGRYSGRPVPKHKELTAVEKRHFTIWLSHFHDVLEETAPTPAAALYFMERAVRIAESLQFAMFGLPSLGAPANARP